MELPHLPAQIRVLLNLPGKPPPKALPRLLGHLAHQARELIHIRELRRRHGDHIDALGKQRVSSPRIARLGETAAMGVATIVLNHNAAFPPAQIPDNILLSCNTTPPIAQCARFVQAGIGKPQPSSAPRSERNDGQLGLHNGRRFTTHLLRRRARQLDSANIGKLLEKCQQSLRSR